MSRDLTSKDAEYTFASPYLQKFSISENIIYYITMKPRLPKGYKMLQKTCKYFYSKNHVIIADTLDNVISRKWLIGVDNIYLKIRRILNIPYNIWVTKQFDIIEINISVISHKIFRFDVRRVHIFEQDLYFDELLLLCLKSIERFWLMDVNVLYSNKNMVPLEKIFALFPNIVEFGYKWNKGTAITSETVMELMKIQNFTSIKKLMLEPICEKFDLNHFSNFMKGHHKTVFILFFSNNVSLKYLAQFEVFIEWALYYAYTDRSYIPPYLKVPSPLSRNFNDLKNLRNERVFPPLS